MTQILNIVLPTQSAGANGNAGIRVPFDCSIVDAYYVSNADVDADDTNFATLTLKANDGEGGAFSAIATAITTETVDAHADTPRAISITSGSESLTEGQVLQIAKTYDGTGAAMAGTVCVKVQREHA